jgi:uncharacterized protein (DUF305 family)
VPSNYLTLAIVLAINAVVMFFLTYALIDELDHFYANINRAYMALIMLAPMAVVMLIAMRAMYPNGTLNAVLIACFVALFAICFTLARTQTPVGNVQFLRSMIPHHSSAILMCERADISNTKIADLCGRIVKDQKEEIAEMKAMLGEITGR